MRNHQKYDGPKMRIHWYSQYFLGDTTFSIEKHSNYQKVFKGKTWAGIEKAPKLKVEFGDKPKPPKALTKIERLKRWFIELPIWSIK